MRRMMGCLAVVALTSCFGDVDSPGEGEQEEECEFAATIDEVGCTFDGARLIYTITASGTAGGSRSDVAPIQVNVEANTFFTSNVDLECDAWENLAAPTCSAGVDDPATTNWTATIEDSVNEAEASHTFTVTAEVSKFGSTFCTESAIATRDITCTR